MNAKVEPHQRRAPSRAGQFAGYRFVLDAALAYAAMVVEGGIRQRMALSGSRMAQAARDPGASLDGALFAVGQARRDLDASRSRWEALPEPMRRDLTVRHRDEHEYAETARRAKAVRVEIGRLRADLWAEPRARVEERLASIAQQLAEAAAASASVRERQAQLRISREARPHGPEAEAAGVAALRDLCADAEIRRPGMRSQTANVFSTDQCQRALISTLSTWRRSLYSWTPRLRRPVGILPERLARHNSPMASKAKW